MTTPTRVLREAIKAVPAVRYALGVGGIVAAVALIFSFKIDARLAFVGAIAMLVLMPILVIFARMSALSGARLAKPAVVFTWFTLSLFVLVTACLVTSVFFRRPVDLQFWIAGTQEPLDIPRLYHPFDNTIFNQFPRVTTLAWEPVPRATHYLIEIQYSVFLGGEWYDLPGASPAAVEANEFTFQFPGAQPGRWRVTAMAGSIKSAPSKWWHFRYEK